MNEIVPSLIAQGVGGLVLGLACVILCLVRPRRYFIWWTVAGVCFALWLLLRGLLLGWASPPAWLPGLLAVAGWWHLTAWTFGLLDYVRGQGPPPRPGRAPARLPLGLCLAGLLAVACCAVLLAGAVSWPMHRVVLCGAQAVVFAASAVVFARTARRTGRLGAMLPAVFLAAFALDRAADLGFLPEPRPGETPSIGVLALSLRTFLIQTATTAGLIVLMLDEEKIALRSALDQLADSEDRFRLVFEHSGVGMALLAPDGRILKANPALLRFLGYPHDTLLNRRLGDLTHPDDDTSHRRPSRRPSEEDSALYEREKRFVHHTGEAVWAKVLRVPVRDAAGHLRYHVGVLVDITERKRAEMALAASEMRYRLRFEHALDGMFLWDEAGQLADVNPAFCRMLGATRDELLGRALADVTPEPEAFADASLAAVGRGGGKTETRLRRKNGALLDVEMSVAATGGEGGRLFHASCRDITDRKRAEEALREERDFSTRILDTAEALILVLDAAGRIRRFNGKCAAVSGYREDELRDRFLWDVLTPAAEVEAVRELFDRLVHGEEPPSRPTESVWLTRQGGERVIAWRYATVRDASGGSAGGVRHVIGTGLDITDERRLQEQLRQAQKMELLGTLVGGLAHDFNNHLTAILGNLDAVLDPSPSEEELSPEKTRQHLTDARRGGHLCAAMTQGLLDFSRRRTGRRVPVDLNRVVQDSLSLLRNALPKIISINLTTEPELWPVSADATQIHQVVMNLAVNARDAMLSKLGGEETAPPELRIPSSSFLLTVRTRNRALTDADCRAQVEARPGRFVELSIEDTGTGMTPEVLARIFEPFFTTKEVGRGTGLGLPMVFGIIKGHGGWLTVESVVGRGSIFRIYLPAADSPAAEPHPQPPVSAPIVRTNGSAGKRRVLVVDDEDLVRDLAKSVLERGGFRVLAASDGTQAIEVYRNNLHPDGGSAIDVVLLDYTMPRMTGLQVLEELRLMNPSVRVIFSSGYALDGDAGPLLESGALAFVAKPYRPQDLVAAVRAAVEG